MIRYQFSHYHTLRSSTSTLKKLHVLTKSYQFRTLHANTNSRPEPDDLLKNISSYVHDTKINSKLAFETAKYCFFDTLGCGLAALKYPQVQKIIEPPVQGMTLANGTKVIGTNMQLDPIQGAFALGTIIRWLDFNDCWLAAEWGHPSDNLGGILAIADYQSRQYQYSGGKVGKLFTVHDVLEMMIKAHEIQGIIALENSFNKLGLDHVILVKVATTATVAKMLGLSESQTIAALSQAFVDGHPMRTYRHAPNTGSRKSWAAGDAVSRAINMVYKVKNADVGTIPSVLSAKTWGFYDVYANGNKFKFEQRNTMGSYVMENILFKISFPAEFHSQTAVEAALKAYNKLQSIGKSYKDIESIRIRTQEAAIRIIDKTGPLYNYADRDHCIQYMTAIPLIYGSLQSEHYTDDIAANTEIDLLREKMYCIEDKTFSKDYLDPEKRSISNALLIKLKDGTVLEEFIVEYPIGHKFRREEGIPLLKAKYKNHVAEHFKNNPNRIEELESMIDNENIENMPVHEVVDKFCY